MAPKFIGYMEFIASHPNCKGLPIDRKRNGSLKWVATGKKRKAWAEARALELGIPIEPGVYAKVMYAVPRQK